MKKITILLALALVVAITLPAVAEVEEVTVGGSIVIRGQMQTPGTSVQSSGAGAVLSDLDGDGFSITPVTLPPVPPIPEPLWGATVGVVADPDTSISPGDLADWTVITLPVGPIDALLLEPLDTIPTGSGFDEDTNSFTWYTQRTRVNVDAKLSGNVRGFVELQSFDIWGDDDPANEDMTAFDPIFDTNEQKNISGNGDDLVQLYQGYIEMNNIGEFPLSLRVGRQELVYGREWLLGNNDGGVNFSGLSFDAIKASYDSDMIRVDAWTAKLDENTAPGLLVEEDGDVDFYGVYATYKGIEDMAIDAYWMYVRNSIANPSDSVDMMHTVGARVAGTWDVMGLLPGSLDYNVEGAFQFGDNKVGADSGEYEGWALNAMAGYTFSDVFWTPRLELEYAFFSGDDDASDGDTSEFVRLFSDVHYGEMNLGGDLDANATNMHIIRGGVSAVPVEKLTLKADLYWFLLAEDDEDGLGKTFGVPQLVVEDVDLGLVDGDADAFPTLVVSTDDNVGLELDVAADYQYTEDLNLRAGWAHFFADDAIENSWGGGSDDDIDYVYVQAALVF